MSKVIKVYKVKDLSSGLYMAAGGGFTKTGKTWNNLGHLKSSLSGQGFYQKVSPYSSNHGKLNIGDYCHDLPNPDLVIIEIVVQETIGNTIVLTDFVSRQRRLLDLREKYGHSFADLVERIEKDDQASVWQWTLVLPHSHVAEHRKEEDELLGLLKGLKIKQNADYRKAASDNRGVAIAFKNKNHAARIKLAFSNPTRLVGIDIKDFVETNLDEAEDSHV